MYRNNQHRLRIQHSHRRAAQLLCTLALVNTHGVAHFLLKTPPYCVTASRSDCLVGQSSVAWWQYLQHWVMPGVRNDQNASNEHTNRHNHFWIKRLQNQTSLVLIGFIRKKASVSEPKPNEHLHSWVQACRLFPLNLSQFQHRDLLMRYGSVTNQRWVFWLMSGENDTTRRPVGVFNSSSLTHHRWW